MEDCDKIKMLLFLIENVDVFTWSPYEVPEVDPEFIFHKLNVDLSFPPKKQKPRRSAKEHVEAIRLEVRRLKEDGAIREIFFLEWLANTVVVKKKTAFISSNKLIGCLSRVSSDRPSTRGPGKDSIHLLECELPLYRDAF